MLVLSHFRGISGDKKKVSARLLIKLSGVRIPDVSLLENSGKPVNKRFPAIFHVARGTLK